MRDLISRALRVQLPTPGFVSPCTDRDVFYVLPAPTPSLEARSNGPMASVTCRRGSGCSPTRGACTPRVGVQGLTMKYPMLRGGRPKYASKSDSPFGLQYRCPMWVPRRGRHEGKHAPWRAKAWALRFCDGFFTRKPEDGLVEPSRVARASRGATVFRAYRASTAA
jgi:hypothetical protein